MGEMTTYPAGTFCWADLATSDTEQAKAFYAQLFGWQPTDVPAGDAGTYTMFAQNGKDVCALYALSEDMIEQGVVPHWQSYVSVDNVDESVQKAAALGGTIVAPAFDVMEVGRMALVRDPTGATFALWQPMGHIGAQLVNEPNTLCWNELQTNDLDAASEFYAALFGWTAKITEGVLASAYTEFLNGERAAAGMLEIQPEWGEVPPNWAVYFAVTDCDAMLETAKSLGGRVGVPPMDIESVGRFAVLQDPQGAHFAVIRLEQPD
jgi:predicted enzyme related to lactoylglutathione lyase